ncbi:YbaB/EbfC family nucleoid-associated protein [Streptosporangium lutulentum]|uniref:DNA-binding protein YbaB n=1 Tax=Streptosporangium lutulentum TaxID=1461250 RepID=A0ABT9QTU8_9ACTN|nr:YbaB/EbfC family nucleoid-associated protein [Streptosporangium lutulentum]MDP9849339.1 DNA-binding protein YbaB [Streptosporangium lutulentum]
MGYPDDATLRLMEDGLSDLTGEGHAAGEMIRAVTDSAGRLLKLTLNPRVMRMDSEELAKELCAAVQRAQAAGERKTRELVGGTLGSSAPEELPDHTRFWNGLREMRESFDRSMNEQEEKVARRLRDLG